MAALWRLKTNMAKLASRLNLSAATAWAAISGLILLVVGGLMVHAGGLLQLLYPLAAFIVGMLLYWRYPALYLGFTWWLWFLTPEVRRLVDYQQGWNPENPVMLAPLLVTALSFFTLLRHLPEFRLYRFFPFGLVFLGLFYGYGVGLFRVGPLAATFDLLNWLVPVVLAFHLVVHWRNYPSYRRVMQHTFVWGVLVMGLYGLLQYFALPAWDHYWLVNAPITSTSSLNVTPEEPLSGSPEPFWLRVFSTLNSQGPFAVVMMAGLLLLLSGGGLLRWPAAAAGYASFLLSLDRGAWGGLLVGLVFILVQGGRRFRLRLLAALAVAVGLSVLLLLTVGSATDEIKARFQSFANLRQDYSVEDRLKTQSEVLLQALLEPVGHGLGSTGVATKLSSPEGEPGKFGNFDNGLLNIPFVLGWLGSLPYVGGLGWLLSYALRGKGLQLDLFAVTSRGIIIAVLALLVFTNVLVGVQGVVFWGFLGLALAARAYHTQNRQIGE